MPGFTTVTRENVQRVGRQEHAGRRPAEAFERPGNGHGHERDAAHRHPQGRDRPELLARRAARRSRPRATSGRSSSRCRASRSTRSTSPATRARIAGGPDFITKGSGNVVYQVDGATTTDNTYGNPFQRQNGGTNTFFDFSTFQDVEVATGGSRRRAADLGRDDQRRHQARHQRDQGRGALHLRLGQLAVQQHAAGGHRPGHPDQQHAHDPRVRRRPRRPDHPGQAVALVRRRLPDDLDEPRPRSARGRTVTCPSTRQPRALEREAELAGLQRQLGAALLPAQRPRPDQRRPRADRRVLARDAAARSRPTSTRSRTRTSSRRTSSPRSSRTIRTPTTRTIAQRLAGLHQRPLQRRVRRGLRRGTSSTTIDSVPQQLPLLLCQGPAEAGQLSGLQVLQHRHAQPRAEVQLQLPPADRRLGHGLARGSERTAASTRTPRPTRRCSPAACGRSSRTRSGAARSATRSRRAI